MRQENFLGRPNLTRRRRLRRIDHILVGGFPAISVPGRPEIAHRQQRRKQCRVGCEDVQPASPPQDSGRCGGGRGEHEGQEDGAEGHDQRELVRAVWAATGSGYEGGGGNMVAIQYGKASNSETGTGDPLPPRADKHSGEQNPCIIPYGVVSAARMCTSASWLRLRFFAGKSWRGGLG